MQRSLVDLDVDAEAGVLHRVEREVLHARQHVALQSSGERRRHHAHVVRVLAVGLLGPAPGGMTEQVHAHRAGVGGAAGAQLGADRLADAFFQVGIERCAASHADRERRRVTDHAPAWPIGEVDSGNPESRHLRRRPRVLVVAARRHVEQPGPQRGVPVEATQLLLERHAGDELTGGIVMIGSRPDFGHGISERGHATTMTQPVGSRVHRTA